MFLIQEKIMGITVVLTKRKVRLVSLITPWVISVSNTTGKIYLYVTADQRKKKKETKRKKNMKSARLCASA